MCEKLYLSKEGQISFTNEVWNQENKLLSSNSKSTCNKKVGKQTIKKATDRHPAVLSNGLKQLVVLQSSYKNKKKFMVKNKSMFVGLSVFF